MKRKINPISKFFVKLLGNEKQQSYTIPLVAIILSLIFGAVIIAILGKNPISAYINLLQGSGLAIKPKYAGGKGLITDLMSFINYWTPMIFASLAVAFALKAGMFNIGVSGQMLAAGMLSSMLIGYSGLNAYVAKPLVIVVSIVAGGLIGATIGFLKDKFNINEVVSSIMLNYIIQNISAFLIQTKYINPVSRQSKNISNAARLTIIDVEIAGFKCEIPLGIILAIIAVFLVRFIFNKTTLGYQLKAIGLNKKAAGYAGINVGRKIVLSMLISGALAGLAGATYYLGYFSSIQPKVLAPTGFDAIAVSLLGNSSPFGIVASSFLISVIGKGKTYMTSASGLDGEIASLIIGLILLFSACGAYIKYKVKVEKAKIEDIEKQNLAEVNADDR